jgi:hypothetical protein
METIWYVEALCRNAAGVVTRRQLSHNLPRRAAAEMALAEVRGSYMLVSVVQGLGKPAKVCPACSRAFEFRNSKPMRCRCGA